jgi:hypothetical protein
LVDLFVYLSKNGAFAEKQIVATNGLELFLFDLTKPKNDENVGIDASSADRLKQDL